MVSYFVATGAAGIVVGIVLEKVIAKMKGSAVMSREEALRACFGNPMCTTNFTLKEAKEWLRSKEEQLKNGSKAAVVKANSNTLKSIGKEINIDGVDNYLVMAVVNKDNNITDSILIKYEKLDQELESALAKGNGCLVVEGSDEK